MALTIEELEIAAMVYATSYDVTERKKAEDKILLFRCMPCPYALCQTILETSSNDCLLFEAAKTISEAVIREWNQLCPENGNGDLVSNNCDNITSYMQQLLTWCSTGRGLQRSSYVRECVLRACAVIAKRHCASQVTLLSPSSSMLLEEGASVQRSMSFPCFTSNTDTPNPRQQRLQSQACHKSPFHGLLPCYLTIAKELIHSNDTQKQLVGVNMWSTLLLEMSLTKDSCRMGLSWGQHHLVRLRFEHNEMLDIFSNLLIMCEQVCNFPGDLTQQDALPLVFKLLSTLEIIFTWRFMPKFMPRNFLSRLINSERQSFAPNKKWKCFFTNDFVPRLLYRLHNRLRTVSELGVLSLSCIVQLSSLESYVFQEQDAAHQYHQLVTHLFMEFLCPLGINAVISSCSTNSDNNSSLAAAVAAAAAASSSSSSTSSSATAAGANSIWIEPIDYEFPLLADIIAHLNRHQESLGNILDSLVNNKGTLSSTTQLQEAFALALVQYNTLIKAIEGAALETLIGSENQVCNDCVERLLCHFISFIYFPLSKSNGNQNHHHLNISSDSTGGASGSGENYSHLDSGVQQYIAQTRHLAWRVFEYYIRAHLADPEGFRNRTPDGHVICESSYTGGQQANRDDEIDVNCIEEDQDIYHDSLLSVGLCGRLMPSESLPLVTRLLWERVTFLCQFDQQRRQQLAIGSPDSSRMTVPHWLLEDLHWIILITTHLLTHLESNSTTGLWPSEWPLLEECQLSLLGNVRDGVALLWKQCLNDYLTACTTSDLVDSVSILERNANLVQQRWSTLTDLTKLFMVILQFLQCELVHQHSPQLSTDLYWLLSCLVKALYYPTSDSNSSSSASASALSTSIVDHSSSNIVATFHCHGGILHSISHFQSTSPSNATANHQQQQETGTRNDFLILLFRLAIGGLHQNSGETDALERIAELMVNFTMNKENSRILLQTSEWWQFVNQLFQLGVPFCQMPMNVCRELVRACVQVAAQQDDPLCWEKTLGPLQYRINQTLTPFHSSHPSSAETNKSRLSHAIVVDGHAVEICCHLLRGALLGVTIPTTPNGCRPLTFHLQIPQLWSLFSDSFLGALPGIVRQFYSEAHIMHPTWKVLQSIVQSILIHLSTMETKKVYAGLLYTIHEYCQLSQNKSCLNVNDELETLYLDINYMLSILRHLLWRSCSIFSDDGEVSTQPNVIVSEASDHKLSHLSTSDVVLKSPESVALQALEYIIPILKEDMFSVPELCSCYYEVVNSLTEVQAQQVWQMNCFPALMNTIQLGITKHGADVNKACLEILFNLAECVDSSPNERRHCLTTFLRIIFQQLTNGEFDIDIIESASSTVLALICCNKEAYKSIVNGLLQSLGGSQHSPRLLAAFEALTPNIDSLSMQRATRREFMHHFQKFVLDARSFLCVH